MVPKDATKHHLDRRYLHSELFPDSLAVGKKASLMFLLQELL